MKKLFITTAAASVLALSASAFAANPTNNVCTLKFSNNSQNQIAYNIANQVYPNNTDAQKFYNNPNFTGVVFEAISKQTGNKVVSNVIPFGKSGTIKVYCDNKGSFYHLRAAITTTSVQGAQSQTGFVSNFVYTAPITVVGGYHPTSVNVMPFFSSTADWAPGTQSK
ncbi:MAG: hypothetical protein KDH94_01505 [Coxiellaceae bacterium]|nr:hypothetical protein [Coxiellaceae bacterium]